MIRTFFRKTALTLGAALAMAAGSAQAVYDRDFTLPLNTSLDVFTTSDTSLGYPASAPNDYTFGQDMFHFTLTTVSDIFITLGNLPQLVGYPGFDSHVTFANIELYNGSGTMLFSTGWFDDASSVSTANPAPSFFSLSRHLAAGNYTLGVFGYAPDSYATDGSGMHYTDTGSYRVTVAIPEPGEWAMLLAGLGVVGVITRRRRYAN